MPSRAEQFFTPLHSYRAVLPSWITLCMMVFIGCLLAGCAAQLAYRNGKDLVEHDRVEEGLTKFQEAIKRDPHNLEYKKAYLQTRDRAVYSYLEQADRLMARGKRGDAEKLYRRVLLIDANSERAQSGLRNIERDERHDQWIKEGYAALEKKDLAATKGKLGAVMTENPDSAAALALQKAITDKIAQSPGESTLALAYKKPITIEFKDAPLKQVFEVIARTSGLNFLFDKEVKLDQRTSIYLKNSTIESAVYFTLLTNQLEQQVLDANTILIFPNSAGKLKDYQEMVVKSFFFTNADAKSVANTLKTIVKSRDIIVDEKLNMLIVRDSPDAIRLAEKLVALHDAPEPEVMLEVEVLEVKRTRLMELGIQWPNSLSLTPLSSATGGALTVRDLRSINSGTIGVGIGPTVIRARNEDGDANLLANPRIRARNHEKAKILIGERVPNITTTATSTGFVSESINYVDVGLKLDVEPTIYLDNDVAIKIALEVSSVTNQIKTQSGSIAYQIGTRTASTVLRLKDGENQVLAGLINDEERRTGNKVPGLGDLPIIGRLFGSTADDNQKTEIVLSITPRLVRNVQRPEVSLAEFRSGTDTSFRVRPDSIMNVPTAVNSVSPAVAKPNVAPTNTSASAAPASDTKATNVTPPVAIPAPTNGPESNAPRAGSGNASGTGASLKWQSPSSVRAGDTFEVQLTMQSDQPVTSIPMTVSYDNKVLQIVHVAEGIFLKQGGAKTSFTTKVDPTGQIQLVSTRTGDGGATSAGSVATLVFRALAPADATGIQVRALSPAGLNGKPVTPVTPAPLTLQVRS